MLLSRFLQLLGKYRVLILEYDITYDNCKDIGNEIAKLHLVCGLYKGLHIGNQ